MSWEYCCPRCKVMLNPTRSVILCAAHKKTRVMIGLSPQLGKYNVYLPPGVEAKDGQVWDFSCPMCHESLRTDPDSKLCELGLCVEGDNIKVLFSRVAGEHATFVINKEKKARKYGEHKDRYDVG